MMQHNSHQGDRCKCGLSANIAMNATPGLKLGAQARPSRAVFTSRTSPLFLFCALSAMLPLPLPPCRLLVLLECRAIPFLLSSRPRPTCDKLEFPSSCWAS